MPRRGTSWDPLPCGGMEPGPGRSAEDPAWRCIPGRPWCLGDRTGGGCPPPQLQGGGRASLRTGPWGLAQVSGRPRLSDGGRGRSRCLASLDSRRRKGFGPPGVPFLGAPIPGQLPGPWAQAGLQTSPRAAQGATPGAQARPSLTTAGHWVPRLPVPRGHLCEVGTSRGPSWLLGRTEVTVQVEPRPSRIRASASADGCFLPRPASSGASPPSVLGQP